MASPPTNNPHKFDTVEVAPRSSNYGRYNDLHLPAFTLDNANSHDNQQIKSTQNLLSLDENSAAKNKHQQKQDIDTLMNPLDLESEDHRSKFGMIDGVLGRCLLCMWGVIMFLRTGWIVGQAGIFQATIVIVASGSITFATTLSLSAICTNGQIEHGGPYYLISRSLGPAFGAVIGILFAIGNCIGVALHLTGFSEAITTLYTGDLLTSTTDDIILFAEIGLGFLLVLSMFGVGWIVRFNLLLLAVMLISIVVFCIGTFTTTKDTKTLGFTGYSSQTFNENWGPAYQKGWTFMAMIGIFFPSVTGCMAGANISGDLKNPSHAIPVGTVIAVLFSLFVYVVIAWMLGATCLRTSEDGTGGLYNDFVIMSNVSLFRPLVDMGIFASTFSSATSCFVAAPRIFKALCDDGLFPFLNFFAVGRESDNEPIRVYFVVFIVCFLVMLSGNINFIAPIVTNFFLITYSLINYSVFVWDNSKLVGWRPTFRYYSGYVSLFTSVACIALMILIDWRIAIGTVVAGILIFKYVDNKNLIGLHWGTLEESGMYEKACKIILKYQSIKIHAKSVRPTFLIFNYGSQSSNKNNIGDLYKLCQAINYSESLIVMGDCIIGDFDDPAVANKYVLRRMDFAKHNTDKRLTKEIISNCVIETCVASTFKQGCRFMLQLSGMGSMKPNIVAIQMDNTDLLKKDSNDSNNIIDNNNTYNNHDNNESDSTTQPLWHANLYDALMSGHGVIMVPSSFSWIEMIQSIKEKLDLKLEQRMKDKDKDKDKNKNNKNNASQISSEAAASSNSSYTVSFSSVFKFEQNQDCAYIDVWWLFDDGGLTILVAYLLSKSDHFKQCKIRLMVLLDLVGFNQQLAMVSLMRQLRIEAEIVEVNLPKGISVLPESQRSRTKLNSGQQSIFVDNTNIQQDIKKIQKEADTLSMSEPVDSVSDIKVDMQENANSSETVSEQPESEEVVANADKIFANGILRPVSNFAKRKLSTYKKIGKIVEKKCQEYDTGLCILTLPFPRKKYEWWEYAAIVNQLMPKRVPTIFVRGNQDQLLTSSF